MKREELLKSKEYWLTQFQISIFNLIEEYRILNKLNRTQLAKELGVSKGYISQVLNGNYDHKISKLVEFCLAFGKTPIINFTDLKEYIEKDFNNGKSYSTNIVSVSKIENKVSDIKYQKEEEYVCDYNKTSYSFLNNKVEKYDLNKSFN